MPKTKKNSKIDKKQSKEIAVLKKQVKALEKSTERKYIDKIYYQNLDGPITTTDSVFEITAMPVWGTSNHERHFEREGQSINLRSFKMRGTINLPPDVLSAVNPPASAEVRMMLVLFPENQAGNATTIGSADILQFRAAQPFTTYNKIDAKTKYKVLYDKTHRLQNANQVGLAGGTTNRFGQCTEKWRQPFNINVKFGKTGRIAEYTTNQGSGSIPVKNRLVLFVWSDYSAANLLQAPYIDAMSRFRFDDL